MIYKIQEEDWVIYTSQYGIDYINKVFKEEFEKIINDQKKEEIKRRYRKKQK